MKVNHQNQNNCMTLSKRPKSGDKDIYQTIMNNNIQGKNKYENYFQSPNKGEDLLFIKKKFQMMKKNSHDKIKNKTSNIPNMNNNSNTNISSSYISFMSPINKNYYNKKQNNALTKFLKNKLILNSIDNSSFIVYKDKEKKKEKDQVIPYINSNNLSNILKSNISNNKILNKNDNNLNNNNNKINHLNNIQFKYGETNFIGNDTKSSKNAFTNSNLIINKKINPKFVSNKKYNHESSYNDLDKLQNYNNIYLKEQSLKDINMNKVIKNRNNTINNINNNVKNKDLKDIKNENIKEIKKISKEKDSTIKINRKSCRFNFFNNISNNNNCCQQKLFSFKGLINNNNNNKKSYKNNSNQNLLSNTVFEYNKAQHPNNINFFENYVKAVAMNKNNKYSINKSISISQSNNLNNISNKKIKQNITFNSNNISNTNTNRETNQNTIYGNKNICSESKVHSPKTTISKTTKSSPKSSFIHLNSTIDKLHKNLKGHIKNKSISIITKSEACLYKNNHKNSNINSSISNNNKYKINFNNNNINYTTTHAIGNNNNLYSNNNGYHQYKYSLNLNKKLKLFEIGINNTKKSTNSPYNVYFKKKTQPNSKEKTFLYNNINNPNKNKMNLNKNINSMNTTGNNSKNKSKNIYINKNHLPKHKNLSSLNNSTHFYYNNMANIGQNTENEINSPNSQLQQYQQTEDIIVNNYNININNQIHNTNTYFSGNIISVDGQKKNKNKNNNVCATNNKTNNIPYKQSLKKKKLFSQSLKDILISNNKNAKHFTANNSPINKLDILLNNNFNKYNEKINKIDNIKYAYKKLPSNRDKTEKTSPKKKVFESISSRKEEIKDKKYNLNLVSKNNIINDIEKNKIDSKTQRKYIDLKKRIEEEIKINNKKNKISVKNISIDELSNSNNININNKNIENKQNENNEIIENSKNNDIILSQYSPTLSSRSSTSYDANYYMKESLKLSCYISKYYNKYKKYPNTSLHFYKYGRLIGQGAFGKVNLGLNILTGRIVAVKSFDKNNAELTGDNMKKIKYETDLMKKLNHPNITKILEMFEDEKYFLIIMEYINGGNLFSFVKKRRKLSEKTAKFLFRQIILGIQYIHQQNIVHRDIKLENLLIDLNNNVKICDFGIGRKIASKNQLLFDQCGTLMYMAPEILLSTKEKGYEGFPVDIWSAGISLYIMLSGTLPFNYKNKKNGNEDDENEENEEEESISDKSKKNDDDNFELQYSIVYKEPKHIEKISDEARDLLKGLLNKDPKKRLTCDQILNHPWLYGFKDKNDSSNKFHLFTKAEMIMLSKTFIDYRRANADDLKENFTLSNLISENSKNKNNSKGENITSKSSILAPYNSLISEYESSSQRLSLKSNDLFDDFNNSKIKLENDQVIFCKKIKEYNRLYELNNNGEVDNGVLINSKTQSSINMSDRSSRSSRSNRNDILEINISSNGSYAIFNENDEKIQVKKLNDKKKEKNKNSKKNVNEELEKKMKINNILNQMNLMGFDKKYVLDCVQKNELCHASAVYYLMMNYENI